MVIWHRYHMAASNLRVSGLAISPQHKVFMRVSRLFAYGVVALVTASSAGQQKAKYLDSGAKVEDRIDDLLHRMTIEEKVSQIVDSWGSPGIQRLSVPALLKTDGLHSQSYSTGATLFPQAISM